MKDNCKHIATAHSSSCLQHYIPHTTIFSLCNTMISLTTKLLVVPSYATPHTLLHTPKPKMQRNILPHHTPVPKNEIPRLVPPHSLLSHCNTPCHHTIPLCRQCNTTYRHPIPSKATSCHTPAGPENKALAWVREQRLKGRSRQDEITPSERRWLRPPTPTPNFPLPPPPLSSPLPANSSPPPQLWLPPGSKITEKEMKGRKGGGGENGKYGMLNVLGLSHNGEL